MTRSTFARIPRLLGVWNCRGVRCPIMALRWSAIRRSFRKMKCFVNQVGFHRVGSGRHTLVSFLGMEGPILCSAIANVFRVYRGAASPAEGFRFVSGALPGHDVDARSFRECSFVFRAG